MLKKKDFITRKFSVLKNLNPSVLLGSPAMSKKTLFSTLVIEWLAIDTMQPFVQFTNN